MKLGQFSHTLQTEAQQNTLKDIDHLLEQSLKYTRTLIAELSPTILYELGLIPAVHWLSKQMANHGLEVKVHYQNEKLNLNEDQAILLYQIIRELLMNVIKHSKVTDADIYITQNEMDCVEVVVADKGVGFDMDRLGNDPTMIGHYGLFSIRERVETIGGCLEIHSIPHEGTQVRITVPCSKDEEETLRSELLYHYPDSRIVPGNTRKADDVISILLVDDHDMVRQGFRALIGTDKRLSIIGEAAVFKAIELARLTSDVIIMDINMPNMNGIEATRIIKRNILTHYHRTFRK